jgi:hypothetical protein
VLRVDCALEDILRKGQQFDTARKPGRRIDALTEKYGLEREAAAQSFAKQILAFDRNQPTGEPSMACESRAKLLYAWVSAAGD